MRMKRKQTILTDLYCHFLPFPTSPLCPCTAPKEVGTVWLSSWDPPNRPGFPSDTLKLAAALLCALTNEMWWEGSLSPLTEEPGTSDHAYPLCPSLIIPTCTHMVAFPLTAPRRMRVGMCYEQERCLLYHKPLKLWDCLLPTITSIHPNGYASPILSSRTVMANL